MEGDFLPLGGRMAGWPATCCIKFNFRKQQQEQQRRHEADRGCSSVGVAVSRRLAPLSSCLLSTTQKQGRLIAGNWDDDDGRVLSIILI
jgi:hypothetical protein